MWLLEAYSKRLINFLGDATEPYAILSHTWEREEVSFLDIQDLEAAQKKHGFRKLEFTCRQALEDGYQYVWIDTCCIDKNSTSELSEAINSMYRWYYNSKVCYTFLSDSLADNGIYDLANCRWFTRGWTLQEIISPPALTLYDHDWNMIGTRALLCSELSSITDVEIQLLRNRDNLNHYCIAQRLAWASRRQTTRVEDQAYCLLGLLGINMPLLYGEGPKAFHRLQQEILANSDRDFSVLSWEPYHPRQVSLVLAPDVYCFRNAAKSEVRPGPPQAWSASWSANGLRAHLPVLRAAADAKFCYIELQNHVRGRFLKIRKVQQPNTESSIKGDVSIPAVYEVARDSPAHLQYIDVNPFLHKPEVSVDVQYVVVTGFRSWNHYVTFDLTENLQILGVFPDDQFYPDQLEFAYSAFVTGLPYLGAVMVNHAAFTGPKIFAFALYVLDDGTLRAAYGWYDMPKDKISSMLLRSTRSPLTATSRMSEALADAISQVRTSYAVEASNSPVASFTGGLSNQVTISAAIAHSSTCGGKTMSMYLPPNQTVIKIWTDYEVKSSEALGISERTSSRWAFDEDERYREYEKSNIDLFACDARHKIEILLDKADIWTPFTLALSNGKRNLTHARASFDL